MNIGYACLALGVPGAEQKSCTLKNASPERLTSLIGHNLDALDRIIDYNIASGIRLFRISSDLIPFGSSPANTLPWDILFEERFASIGEKIRLAGMRVSMHPGQYTVLNAPDAGVAGRAAEDLAYHARVLDALGVDGSHKIVLHIGGAYDDRKMALKRFDHSCRRLPGPILRRLAIENDDRIYTIADALETGARLDLPVIYDNLHNSCNPPKEDLEDRSWIDACSATWRTCDGRQKIHYSQQEPGRRPGSHSSTIRIRGFLDFLEAVGPDPDLDIMLEVKDKNLSAVKCILATDSNGQIRNLEKEWARYKYTVLERSPLDYQAIRALLSDKGAYPAVEFYGRIEQALASPPATGNIINAAEHVWGYFKDVAGAREKAAFRALLDRFGDGRASGTAVKAALRRLAIRHESHYLLDSYYFML